MADRVDALPLSERSARDLILARLRGIAPIDQEEHERARADARPAVPSIDAVALLPALEEIDYGLVVVDARKRVVYANRAALAHCREDGVLTIEGSIRARHPASACAFRVALDAAFDQKRSLIAVQGACGEIEIAFVPLRTRPGEPSAALLSIGRARLCEALSIDLYASRCGLTFAESRVLKELCGGVCAGDIARRFGIAISTVRTQINSIRTKTRVRSLTDLIRTVAMLPPVVSSLRLDTLQRFESPAPALQPRHAMLAN